MILERTSIILVDDHQMIMDGLERIIQELPGFEVLASYHNPIEALEKVPLLKPDILIADLEMPQMNGLEMVGLLKRSTPQLTTLLLTMHLDYTMAQKAMKMGVNGYILKNLDKSELQVALLQLKKGKNYFSAEVTEVLSTKSNALERSMSSKRGLLTKKEMEVLRLIQSLILPNKLQRSFVLRFLPLNHTEVPS